MYPLKKLFVLGVVVYLFFAMAREAAAQTKNLRLIFIRHAEKPEKGDNLSCKGINRSLALSSVLYKKFGKADKVYVPGITLGKQTKRVRMLETIAPYTARYNLEINTQFDESDCSGIGQALIHESGTVIIVWEHKYIDDIIHYLGVRDSPQWPDDDFDSIRIITFSKGQPSLFFDTEGIRPSERCNF